ncbi:S-arrestin-like [Morone saxatilis]|uniref:S-arrestin-like n=1 Tax=Morone saxatilis TaxID=34816 RepID=UPI0015E21E37|nr:S-arrestin-like [Morone saxatilis]
MQVFKVSALLLQVGVYMGKRDFVDHVDSVDPVDGVVIIDPEALQGRKAFVTLSCIFRYGRDDMDVMGIAFRRELYLSTRQVYPPLQDRDKGVHTRMQAKLLRKLGDNAYPFFFEFPDNLPCSVALQPAPSDVGKQCAVEFEIKVFSAESQDAKIRKRSTVKLMLRKVQYAPEGEGVAPTVETTRDFVMSDKPLHVKASLDKEIYYHGEALKVHVTVTNNSSKNVKNIIISVDQVANVVLFSNDSYVKCVAIEEPGSTCVLSERPEIQKNTPNHRFRPIDEAAQQHKKELQETLEPLKEKLKPCNPGVSPVTPVGTQSVSRQQHQLTQAQSAVPAC